MIVQGDWWPEARRLVEVEGLTQAETSGRLGVSKVAVWYANKMGWVRHCERQARLRQRAVAMTHFLPDDEVAAKLHLHPKTVELWRRQAGLLRDATWTRKRWLRNTRARRQENRKRGQTSFEAVVSLVQKHPGLRTRALHAHQDRLGYTRFWTLLRRAAKRGLVTQHTVHDGGGLYSIWRPVI